MQKTQEPPRKIGAAPAFLGLGRVRRAKTMNNLRLFMVSAGIRPKKMDNSRLFMISAGIRPKKMNNSKLFMVSITGYRGDRK
ncbi:hypothetical protein [Trichococcus patagoniensis]|uniref:hypothetical protein n=1 Tax=Trichococcus patagoniensis TaxID=382641 RepID=UPI000D39C72F|nr:hypothetical protein [Trichococcus patagoniensis]